MRTMYPRMKESAIQRSVVEYARNKGITAIKLSTQGAKGNVGYPDFLFLYEGKNPLFIEFKQAGGNVSPHQTARMEILRKKGFTVTVCASTAYGKAEIDRWMLDRRLHGAKSTGNGTK